MQYIKISFERLPTEDLSTLDSIRTRLKITLVNGQSNRVILERLDELITNTLSINLLAIHKRKFQPGSYRIERREIFIRESFKTYFDVLHFI